MDKLEEVQMDKLEKVRQWIVCPVCRNDKKKYPDGCNLCLGSGNPGYVQTRAKTY